MKLSEFDEAITAYKKVIDINPQNPDAYANLGLAFSSCGKLGEALVAYKKAIDINPTAAEFYNNIGVVYYDQGNLHSAMDAFQNALSINCTYREALENLLSLTCQLAESTHGKVNSIVTKYNEIDANTGIGPRFQILLAWQHI